ncbi:MAG TPA: glycosyltransferase family A protein [Candidatus Ratteibacteria bacterium]|uniref:Chondroitin synthase n=1 Tax=candidate division TA06 bacterium ADurb.Bin131 TaxID=1852827 RepID=A0A1V6C8T7_UNCT6|nr:MAG: Chondroitin synthase [candidate division TA06 bacterium ADurb.Bin131]HON05129.1 glycosyltransferase family A protein [bacterium]HRS05702.1 glycosyltransferase family A protein [Candidatus Ratteibacteria bacterium]HRV03574.1 glycosyltransferase family A protein [Candidatus Ratteibacteria bacterium]
MEKKTKNKKGSINQQPLVTIGIPTYNSGNYIGRCLESILRQTYTNLEIIVSDNGSTDDTERIVRSYKDTRVIFNRNSANLFCYGNYNVIIKLAKGEFLAIYHSDDIYDPFIVQKEVEFLQNHSRVPAVFTQAYIINSKDKIIGERRFPEIFSGMDIIDFKIAYNGFLRYGDFLMCPSAMFVKKIFSEVGPFKEENFFASSQSEEWSQFIRKYNISRDMIFKANDLEMWLRILQKFPIGILHENLMYYRVYFNQSGQQHIVSSVNFFIVMDYYSVYARKKNIISESSWRKYEIRKIQERFLEGQNFLSAGNFLEAQKQFKDFIKSRYFFNFCLSFKDLWHLFWSFLVIYGITLKLGPFFQKVLAYRIARRNKKMELF